MAYDNGRDGARGFLRNRLSILPGAFVVVVSGAEGTAGPGRRTNVHHRRHPEHQYSYPSRASGHAGRSPDPLARTVHEHRNQGRPQMAQYLLSVWHDAEYVVDFNTPEMQR